MSKSAPGYRTSWVTGMVLPFRWALMGGALFVALLAVSRSASPAKEGDGVTRRPSGASDRLRPARVATESRGGEAGQGAMPTLSATGTAPIRAGDDRFAEPKQTVPAPEAKGCEPAVTDSGWLYLTATEGEWTESAVERLQDLFLHPPDRETWAMALWAVQRCPSPEVPDWVERFVQGSAPIEDRSKAVLAVATLDGPAALAVLERGLRWCEEGIRTTSARAIVARAEWDAQARPLAESVLEDPMLRPWHRR